MFCQDLLIHFYRPPGIFAWLPALQDDCFLSLEEVILEYQAAFSDPSFPPGPGPMGYLQAGPQRLKFIILNATTVVLKGFLPFSLLLVLWMPPGSLQLKAACDLHVPEEPFLFSKYEVQHRMSHCWLLSHLGQEYVSALQEHSRCLSLDVSSFLQIPEWFKFSPMRTGPVIVRLLVPVCRGLYLLVFLARCPVADAHSLQCHPYWSAP